MKVPWKVMTFELGQSAAWTWTLSVALVVTTTTLAAETDAALGEFVVTAQRRSQAVQHKRRLTGEAVIGTIRDDPYRGLYV